MPTRFRTLFSRCRVTIDGAPFGPLPVADRTGRSGNNFTVSFSPVPPGNYSVQVVALNFLGLSDPSPPAGFTVAGPPAPPPCAPPSEPILNAPQVLGSTVTLTWLRTDASTTGFDIEAIVQASGQTLNMATGNETSRSFGNVPPGNFIVRIRARNACGMSSYTAQRLVIVGVDLLQGDMQATLTWNTTADIDLHVIEPSGREVFYANRTGVTANLDRDDTDGFGPENIYVPLGRTTPGIYRVFIVHFSGAGPTTATIAITTNLGTSALITRQTGGANRSLAINVANVNVASGEIVAIGGTSAAFSAFGTMDEIKIPEPDPPSIVPVVVRPPQ